MLSWYFICYDYVWCEFQIYFHFMILGFGVLENFLRSPLFHTYTKNMIAYVPLKIFRSHTRKIVFLLSYNITIISITLRGREHVIKFHHIFMTRYFILPSQQQFSWTLYEIMLSTIYYERKFMSCLKEGILCVIL